MSLLISTHTRLAIASIRRRRARSFLTCLGIAIGIASIILILSLTGSITRLITSELGDAADDLIVVRPTATKDTVTSIVDEFTLANTYQRSNLSTSDIRLIQALEPVTSVTPIAVSTHTITDAQNIVESATVLGTTPDFASVSNLELAHGTFLTNDNKSTSVVLGHMLSLLLFNTSNPVGRTITFYGRRFIVVGVLTEVIDTVNFNNLDYNNSLIIDIDTLEELLGAPQIQQLNIRVADPLVIEDVAHAITDTITTNHSGDTNFSVSYGDALTHPVSNLLSIVSGILSAIAAIALILGGISVMNIMLASVAERIHEIGIRKSVGASSLDILLQFIFEAAILSLLGGFTGIILGYVAAFFVSVATPFAPYLELAILFRALLISLVVGILAGIYPAVRAASQDPIEALKHNR